MNAPNLPISELLVYATPGEVETLAGLQGVMIHEVSSPAEMKPGDHPAAFLVPEDESWNVDRLREIPAEVVLLARSSRAQLAAGEANRAFVPISGEGEQKLLSAQMKSAARQSSAFLTARRTQARMREVNKIGMALMSERDPDKVLSQILTQARRLTTSDAGSLYLVVEGEDGVERLHFLLTQNDSLPGLPDPDFILPLDTTSIAGYVGSTLNTLVLEDAYEIPEGEPYAFNRGFDETMGYRGKSMLVVPMVDHRDRVVGVIQLINRKRDPSGEIRDEASARAHVIPFSQKDVELVQGLAGQAAVSIENGRLYRDIENVFEGFIRAAVTAIDQRDPTTSGHSVRVTTLTCDLAQAANDAHEGPYKDVFFSQEEMKQLRYAGLLHDFGKVGVREEVLVKMNKLPPLLEANVLSRFDYIHQWMEADTERRKRLHLQEDGKESFRTLEAALDSELAESLERLERYRQAVLDANRPRVLPEAAAEVLEEIATASYIGPDGAEHPYLTELELHFLRIPKGSLDPEERKQIESHVTHSFEYLRQIPWTDGLQRIAEIVQGHHEKLDGSGYPSGVEGAEIPLETRFMTVCDIFDALTASDRPYKKAMPVERALSILQSEAEAGQLDPDAVALFIESMIYEKVLTTHWRDL